MKVSAALKKTKSPAKRKSTKAVKKTIKKKSTTKRAGRSPSKKSIKSRAKTTTKKTPAKSSGSSKNVGIKVRDVISSVDPKIKLTDDAVELLEDLFVKKFTQIATKAVEIVHRGKQENMGCEDVKKAVNQVFVEKFKSGAKSCA